VFKKKGLSLHHKCIATICMLVYGIEIFGRNEYCHLRENTTMNFFKEIVWDIQELFELFYLRQPT
jgi:hypothetical protein